MSCTWSLHLFSRNRACWINKVDVKDHVKLVSADLYAPEMPMGPTPQAVKHLFMFITHPTWKVEGAPGALLTPAIPWHSALLDVSEPCFIVAPNVNAQIPLTHIRLFSDIDELLAHVHCEIDDEFIVYALSRFDDALSISVVTAIGSYPCPQTGIKLRVYFDDGEQPRPAHSGQPQFDEQRTFDIEASFS